MANVNAVPGSERGRHRRPRKRVVVAMTVLATCGAGAVTVGAAAVFGDDGTAAGSTGCRSARTLRVVAAPEVAPAVERVASASTNRRCVRVTVEAADPATTAAALRRGDRQGDVWIPDSSMWAATVTAAPTESIASSPVVLALPVRTARTMGADVSYERVGEAATTGRPFILRAAAAPRSATTQAALIDLRRSLDSTPTQRGQLAALLRSLQTRSAVDLRPSGTRGQITAARVVTEKAVRAANMAARRRVFVAVHPTTNGTSMDYPYVVLSDNPTVRTAARRLLDGLRSPAGRAILDGSGFRTDQSVETTDSLTTSESRAALETLALVDRPTRTLALVDVSGSMASPVPGAASGATRMDLARTAIRRGVGLLPEGTVAGLWRFSADLTPSTDYEPLAPLTELTPRSRDRFASALGRLHVDPDGGTGLYSSTLAAVRYVRSGYDATRVNSVIVLSDGKDQDATAHGISLEQLLAGLRAQDDPRRPVIVIAIAYGPDSDTAALRRISAATGGTLYTASDPRELPLIFSQAIGHRFATTRP